jgi:hypothetical protein
MNIVMLIYTKIDTLCFIVFYSVVKIQSRYHPPTNIGLAK